MSLFSRTEPVRKSQLDNFLQDLGLVVALVSRCLFQFGASIDRCVLQTGDDINNVPMHNDGSVAIGSITDVAKFTANMVLADLNIVTIEKEGRPVYNNTKQLIHYLSMSSSSSFCMRRD